MTELQKNIISLISAAINSEKPDISGELNIDEVYSIAKNHQIVPLVYYGLAQLSEQDNSGNFFVDTCKLLAFSEKQKEAVNRICSAFEKNNIEYMLLKGSVLKNIYPKPEMRTMSDADILINTKQYDKIKPIMQMLGFAACKETDHELVWLSKNNICIELHKRLIPSYNKDYYKYFGDGWNKAKKTEHGYEMTAENNFIYLFTHFAKHYRDSGAGIKYVVDFYVLRRKYPKINESYIVGELEKLQLLKFYKNIMYLTEVWFNHAPPTEISDFLTDKIFGFGTYGVRKTDRLSEGLKLSKKHKYAVLIKLWSLLFPHYDNMCDNYPILKRYGFLLPVIWVIHWFDVLINRKDRIKYQSKILRNMSNDKIKAYQKELNYVGLDFNFK